MTLNELEKKAKIYYSKEVLHHLIFTTFLNNVLYKYTKNIFLNIILPLRVGLIVCHNNKFVRNILLKPVKMHFSGNTEFWGILKKSTYFFTGFTIHIFLKIGTLETVKNPFSQKKKVKFTFLKKNSIFIKNCIF